MQKDQSKEEGLSRRSFLTGAGVVVAGTAMAGMAGCQPQAGGDAASETTESSAQLIDDSLIAPGRRATPTLENAEPIPPEDPPAEWTKEVDIVVVGTGGGGLNAALLSRQMGAEVVVVEKNDVPGGATQHANLLLNLAGTGTAQKEMGFATPEFPYDRDSFLRWLEPHYQFSVDNDLHGNVSDAAGECLDWMIEQGADLVCVGPYYHPRVVDSGEMHKVLSMRELTTQFHELGEAAGVEYHFNSPCTALVVEDGRVVGIKATDGEGDKYYKANKGVILCSGGMGMNPDMLKKYIPTAYKSAVIGGPMPYHTGDCTRMALALGADMSGVDSWCMWESEMDNDSGEWIYFWGARQLTQLPWLNIDLMGNRCNYYEWDEFFSNDDVYYQFNLPYFQDGHDCARVQVQTSRIGHRAYAIFDGKFEEYIPLLEEPVPGEKHMIVPEDKIPEQDLFDTDWHVDFENALIDGRMKQANTLEELAKQLGMEPDILKGAVDTWNDSCKKGVDTGTIYPYPARFLNPIVEPPFYGAKIGGRIGKTLCGLRIDSHMRVLTTEGHVIPGLYANFTTAGGFCGESTYGTSLVGSSILGGNNLSWSSGYYAAKVAMTD
jgi:hypothetical protein